jgi:hypothetical protein
LAGRAGQSALYTATTSNPQYDRGAGIHRHTRQGCKKSAKIKLLVDNTYGIKTLLIIPTNYIIKAVKDEK